MLSARRDFRLPRRGRGAAATSRTVRLCIRGQGIALPGGSLSPPGGGFDLSMRREMILHGGYTRAKLAERDRGPERHRPAASTPDTGPQPRRSRGEWTDDVIRDTTGE